MPGARQRGNQMALNLSPCHVAKRSCRINFGSLAVANGSFSSECIYWCVCHITKQTNQIIFLNLKLSYFKGIKTFFIRTWSCSEGSNNTFFYLSLQSSFRSKEVQIVYRLFLVNYYLLHGNMQSQTEADRKRSIYCLHGRFSDSLKWLGST